MKRITLIILILLRCFSVVFAQVDSGQEDIITINNELQLKKIAKGLFMVTHFFPWGGNSLVNIQDNNQAVLIDTPYDGVATAALLDWFEKTYGQLAFSAIVTGFHQDNLGGNEVLIARNIPVYGMKLTSDLVKNEGDGLKKVILESVNKPEQAHYYQRYTKLKLTPPNHIFDLKEDESYIISIHGYDYVFYYPGKSHTIDNAVVYIPSKQMLFGGCMIRAMADKRPGYIGYADMVAWPVSVQKVKDKFPDCKKVVPGHGEEGGFELVQHTIEILKNLNYITK